MLTGKELADLVQKQVGQAYVWGGLGYKLTEARLTQLKNIYPKAYPDAYHAKARRNLGKNACDCVGLLKYFKWGNRGDSSSQFKYDAATDFTANAEFKTCTQTGKITDMPNEPGLMVWQSGHCGVHIGDGKIVEARGIDYGVVQTTVNTRNFTHYGRLPWKNYYADPVPEQPTNEISWAEAAEILKAAGITKINL